MRDDQIFKMHDMNVKRDALMLRQFEFLNTRIMAYEQVLSTTSGILKAIWDPRWLKREVDLRQTDLLAQAQRTREAVVEKHKAAPQIIKPVLVKA